MLDEETPPLERHGKQVRGASRAGQGAPTLGLLHPCVVWGWFPLGGRVGFALSPAKSNQRFPRL